MTEPAPDLPTADLPAPDLSVTEARQARFGRHAFVVLIASLVLVVIAFAAVFLAHARRPAASAAVDRAPAEVARGVTTEPAPAKQTSAQPAAGG